jgi:mono/diheme cytochrome c family protein
MMASMRVYVLAAVVMVSLAGFARESRGDNVRPASQTYRRYCVSCHGTDGKATTSKGKFSHARNLTDAQWQADVSDARIFNSIMNGRNQRGNMPAFADKLNEKEVNLLISFVRGLKAQ